MTTPLRPVPDTVGPTPLLRDVFGTVLRRTRRERGRTLRAVAEQSRVSLAYLSEIERGRKEASSEVLAAVCTALGISVLDLVVRAQHDLTARPATSVRSYARAPVGGSAVTVMAA